MSHNGRPLRENSNSLDRAGGSAGGAGAARRCRLAWFPPAATSNRACGSLAHGSPTPFTAGIRSAPLDPPVPEGAGGDDELVEADQSHLVAGVVVHDRPAIPR
jgi:hypothetical protein